MQILFTRFPLESHYGGAEVQTLSLMKGLQERGHEVMFLGSCPVLLERCQVLGVRCQELNIDPPPVTKWGAASFLWKQFEMKRKLIVEVMRCFNTALPRHTEPRRSTVAAPTQHDKVLFMLSLSEKLLLTSWAVERGIRVFWIEHDRIGRWLTLNPWLPRLRRLSNLATTIVVSDLSRDLYLKLGWEPEKVVSVPNGIDTIKFRPHDVLRQAQHDVLHVGCVARLTYDKGVDLLIEAIADLPNVTLTIIGQGKEEESLRTLIEKTSYRATGLPRQQICLLSSVPDLVSFYHSLDVLVLPSRSHDPFGLVVAEAMAAGIPTIVTDACGIARHLSKEEALIVPAGSAHLLRNAIETLMKFPQLRRDLGERGPKIARERFTAEKMVNAYEELLH